MKINHSQAILILSESIKNINYPILNFTQSIGKTAIAREIGLVSAETASVKPSTAQKPRAKL
jgi:hypothetical protein